MHPTLCPSERRRGAPCNTLIAQGRVERALYARAVGYECETVKVMQHEGAPIAHRRAISRAHSAGPGSGTRLAKEPPAGRLARPARAAGADGPPMELKTVTHFVDSKDQTRAK